MLITTPPNRDRPDVARRSMIAGVAAALLAACLWRLPLPWWRRDGVDSSALAARLVSLLGLTNHPMLTRFAEDAFESLPISLLLKRLLGESPGRAATMADAELRAHLKRRVVRDYETGRMQSVHGWLLSTTEYDALNLAHVLHREARHR